MFTSNSPTLFLDVETSDDGRIYGLGAVYGDRKPLGANNARAVQEALPALRIWANEASFVCGHNSLLHDFPLLERTSFGRIAEEKRLDTLLLSPLAFPKKPYHALVKDGKLVSCSRNDPIADSMCCSKVLEECVAELSRAQRDDLLLYETAFSAAGLPGIAKLIRAMNDTDRSADRCGEGKSAASCLVERFRMLNRDRCCMENLPTIAKPDDCLVFAYIHSWLNVSGADSVLPYWLCHRFPQIRAHLHMVRTRHCGIADCGYCSEMHSPAKALQRYFQFDSFRQTPCVPGEPDKSLQENIVTMALEGRSSLSILPTGGGKSICFQLPALHRYECTGALSIIVSPLQSLMKDQVENLRSRVGILHCNALYGLLTPLERKACLHDISQGSVGLIYVAPEQLRSVSFRAAIRNREIALWVYDEAHCLSKWGHDFRPDYLYAAKFIRELAQEQGVEYPQIMALTATAKKDVKDDICDHFKDELGADLLLNDGGTDRPNLNYSVERVSSSAKLERIIEILSSYYGVEPSYEDRGSVVVFTATRRAAQEFSENLCLKGWNAKAFHGGLEIEVKKQILEEFLSGTLKIIVSTNAFGMGVDKPDIRYVIHVDSPGSLENYLQEAGRAGRDGAKAECILLFDENDLETQHGFVALSKITKKDIQIIWKAIRSAKSDENGAIVLTVDEILSDKAAVNVSYDAEQGGNRKTKTQTAIALLERQGFLERKENRARVFQASSLVKDLEEASERIHELDLTQDQNRLWMAVMEQFFEMPENKCSEVSQFSQIEEIQLEFERAKKRDPRISSVNTIVFKVLNAMAKPGVALLKKDLLFTAFLKSGNRSSANTLKLHSQLESEFIKLLQVEEPTADGFCVLNLRMANEALCREGLLSHVETLGRTVKYLRDDWTKLESGVPGLEISQFSSDLVKLQLRSNWEEVLRLSTIRRELAALILEVLQSKQDAKTGEIVSFSESELIDHVMGDLSGLASQVNSLPEALHHALLWMHDGKVIELQQGKSLITSAMTLYLKDHKKGRRARSFSKGDYAPLAVYYVEKILQVHIIGEYAAKGIQQIGTHLHFIKEYFRMEGDRFIKKFFSGKEKYLEYATGIESYRKIYEDLDNPRQQAIVAAHEQNNILILAGPGSGKTRVIVHRCAWLLRVDRVRARGVVILCFNRFAALEIRRRLWGLVGQDASGVTILTFHGLALRILGRTMADLDDRGGDGRLSFEDLIPEANRILRSDEVPIGMDADEFREKLVGTLTHILVDEYQDIGPDAYELVSLIAGKSKDSEVDKLSIMAVGDDDQSIYRFAGANVEFIRRYETDYANRIGNAENDRSFMERHYLIENYRSTKNIIAVSNRLISHNLDRMKIDYPIVCNRDRQSEPAGGNLEARDDLTRGLAQIIKAEDQVHQAEACVTEIMRLKSILPDTSWREICVFARTNEELTIVRLILEDACIPVAVLGEESMPRLRRERTIHRWLNFLKSKTDEFWTGERLQEQLRAFLAIERTQESFGILLDSVASAFYGETGGREQRVADIRLFFDEILAEKNGASAVEGVRLSTAHKAKGLEFDHVIILDGNWQTRAAARRELEEERKVFYVAMTRARRSLALFRLNGARNRFIDELVGPETVERNIVTERSSADKIGIKRSILGLEELWIDFAATRYDGSASLIAIDRLDTGDPLSMHSYSIGEGQQRLELRNQESMVVARLSIKGVSKWKSKVSRIIKIRVVGIHIRKSSDGNQNHTGRPHLREEWGIPICEIYHK